MKKGLLVKRNFNYQGGFSLAELLVVILVISLLLALGGAFSPKSAYRRSVDSVTTQVANTLQLTKLKSARAGVEFRTRFIEADSNLRLITERGDSNTDSSVWTSIQDGVNDIRLDSSVEIFRLPSRFEFNPDGTGGPSNSFVIISKEGTKVDRYGRVIVSGLGRIGVVQGHWNGSNCIQVSDKEP